MAGDEDASEVSDEDAIHRARGRDRRRARACYVDRETGEPLEVVAQLLPLAPTPSDLPWSVENLRFCNWCDQLCQRDLNDCPHCGRRLEPLDV